MCIQQGTLHLDILPALTSQKLVRQAQAAVTFLVATSRNVIIQRLILNMTLVRLSLLVQAAVTSLITGLATILQRVISQLILARHLRLYLPQLQLLKVAARQVGIPGLIVLSICYSTKGDYLKMMKSFC